MSRVPEPAWVVLSTTTPSHSRWGGTRWDFFDDKVAAEEHRRGQEEAGAKPLMRQYCRSTDLIQLTTEQFREVVAHLGEGR